MAKETVAAKTATPKTKATTKTKVKEVKVDIISKTALIEQVTEATGEAKKTTGIIVNAVIDQIIENLVNGNSVQLKGFCNFDYKVKAARKGRNPQTGDEIQIAEQPVISVKAGRTLKREVKEAYAAKLAKKKKK